MLYIIILFFVGVFAGCNNDTTLSSTESETVKLAKQHKKQIEELLEQYFVPVPGGTFTMGCNWEDKFCGFHEGPAHSVTLSSFRIGKHELTQQLWKLVMGDNPSEYKGNDLPVTNVSWDDIQVFISVLNAVTGKEYRLPTEAEWEYAARGGNKSKGYRYSGSDEHDDVAWHAFNSDHKIQWVGTKQPNELGIYDMSGNVREWVNDWYAEEYSSSPEVNPKGPSAKEARSIEMTSRGHFYVFFKICISLLFFESPLWQFQPERVTRGGSYGDSDDGVYMRSYSSPDNHTNYIGFRLVRGL